MHKSFARYINTNFANIIIIFLMDNYGYLGDKYLN